MVRFLGALNIKDKYDHLSFVVQRHSVHLFDYLRDLFCLSHYISVA